MNTHRPVALSPIGNSWIMNPHVYVGAPAQTRKITLTAGALGFLFAARTVLVLITARWLNWGTEPGVIAGIVAESALLFMATFQACGPTVRPTVWIFRLPCVRFVLLFLAFSGCSLAWSEAASKLSSFIYWGQLAADVAIVLLFLRSETVVNTAHSIMKGYIVASLFLAAVAWLIPASSDLRLGDLDYFNTNQIANLCAMAAFLAQFLASRKDGRWRLSLFFLTLTLLRSMSKATLIAFLLSQGVMLFLDTSMTRRRKVALFCTALVLMLAFGGLFESYYNVYITAGNQATTLTGRTGIWIYSLNAGIEKPWIGNGIDSMWKVAPPFGPEMFEARHAENELLQQFFAYGVVGIVMLVGIYGSLYRSIRSLPRGSTRSVLIGLLLFILIRGLAEAEPFDLLLPLWSIILISAY
jgi:exopolysaccharide production protein ExoQ